MGRHRSKQPFLPCLILLTFACIAAIAMGWIGSRIAESITLTFGLPSPSLSYPQALSYGIRLYFNQDDLLLPAATAQIAVPFHVELGETASSISYRLQTSGIIRDGVAFGLYLAYSGLDKTIQAGDYQLDPSVPAITIAQRLQDATPTQVDFFILPGWRLEEIAAALPTSGLAIQPGDFLEVVQRNPPDHPILAEIPSGKSLEGFLLGFQYTIPRDITTPELVRLFLDHFQTQLTSEIINAFQNQGLTIYEGVTLASIVEKESVVSEEKPLIASVFYNRLKAGMKLESDPTVQYGLGFMDSSGTWWKNPLNENDLQTNSPYNTYAQYGLPPGPIASSSLSTLQAVAFPAQTPYYYFRARCDGSGRHAFAKTFEEHIQNACE